MVLNHLIAVIAVEPTGKAFFVYTYAKTRPMGQYNGKWPLSLVYVLKPLITGIRAIAALWQFLKIQQLRSRYLDVCQFRANTLLRKANGRVQI